MLWKKCRKLFSIKPVLLCLAWFGRACLFLLLKTLRLKIEGQEEFKRYVDAIAQDPAAATPIIVALWHEQLILAPLLRECATLTPCVALVSGSRDGKLLATFIKTYSEADVITATSKNRSYILKEVLAALQARNILLITPDDPRGPRREVKMGVIYSAMKSGALIFPLHWRAHAQFQLPTWDRFSIPYPFSKVTFTLRPPISCTKSDNAQELAKLLANCL